MKVWTKPKLEELDIKLTQANWDSEGYDAVLSDVNEFGVESGS